MTRPKKGDLRIAIGGTYLDEVQIRQAGHHMGNAVAYLSFPARRHWAHVDGDHITVAAQAQTVVKLFADGVLPPVPSPVVESGATNAVDDMIVLRFRSSKAQARRSHAPAGEPDE